VILDDVTSQRGGRFQSRASIRLPMLIQLRGPKFAPRGRSSPHSWSWRWSDSAAADGDPARQHLRAGNIDCRTPISTVPGANVQSVGFSRWTSAAFLSSRIPTYLECRRWPSLVHSTNSNCATRTGFSHRHSSIFAAVSPAPQRPAFFSGRLANGQSAISGLQLFKQLHA
jgi:hypothetical protein